jgi:hypothetical protein
MSRKTLIWIGAIVGSTAGGYLPMLFGVSAFSMTSIIGGVIGGLLGIWLAFRMSN